MWISTTGGDYSRSWKPWEDIIQTSDGTVYQRGGYTYYPDPSTLTTSISGITESDWYKINGIDIKSEEEIPKMKTYDEYDPKYYGRRYAVACSHEPDLQQDRILKSISMMKSKLMMQCAPVRVDNIECKMTPKVKENIIMAYKRLSMYGKKTPFVARFDEYGRRLPDEVKIDTLHGMTIQIIDPAEFGPYYLSFEGVVHDMFRKVKEDVEDNLDLPF